VLFSIFILFFYGIRDYIGTVLYRARVCSNLLTDLIAHVYAFSAIRLSAVIMEVYGIAEYF